MTSNYYNIDELNSLGLKSFGKNVMISKRCSIYGADNIEIANNVRIDDFCILSGNISIGNYVHISAYSALYGRYGIVIGDFCGISPRCTLFSASDDFSGEYMISPMVPNNLTHLQKGKIVLNNYCQIGANSIVMPSVTLGEGSVCGAFSFVNQNLSPWTINIGVPCHFFKIRHQKAKELSEILLKGI